jgi:hypothetical protein
MASTPTALGRDREPRVGRLPEVVPAQGRHGDPADIDVDGDVDVGRPDPMEPEHDLPPPARAPGR